MTAAIPASARPVDQGHSHAIADVGSIPTVLIRPLAELVALPGEPIDGRDKGHGAGHDATSEASCLDVREAVAGLLGNLRMQAQHRGAHMLVPGDDRLDAGGFRY